MTEDHYAAAWARHADSMYDKRSFREEMLKAYRLGLETSEDIVRRKYIMKNPVKVIESLRAIIDQIKAAASKP